MREKRPVIHELVCCAKITQIDKNNNVHRKRGFENISLNRIKIYSIYLNFQKPLLKGEMLRTADLDYKLNNFF